MKAKISVAFLYVTVMLLLSTLVFAQRNTTSEKIEIYSEFVSEEGVISLNDANKLIDRIIGGDLNVLRDMNYETEFKTFRQRYVDRFYKGKEFSTLEDSLSVSPLILGPNAYTVLLRGLYNKTPEIRIFSAQELGRIYMVKWKNPKYTPKGVKFNFVHVRNEVGQLINLETSIPAKRELKTLRQLLTRIVFWPTVQKNPYFFKTISKDTFQAFSEPIDIYPAATIKLKRDFLKNIPDLTGSINTRTINDLKDKFNRLSHPFKDPTVIDITFSKQWLNIPYDITIPSVDGSSDIRINYDLKDHTVVILGGTEPAQMGQSLVKEYEELSWITNAPYSQSLGDVVKQYPDERIKYRDLAPLDNPEYIGVTNHYIALLANGMENDYFYNKYRCARRLYEMRKFDENLGGDFKTAITNALAKAYNREDNVQLEYAVLYWDVLMKSYAYFRFEATGEKEEESVYQLDNLIGDDIGIWSLDFSGNKSGSSTSSSGPSEGGGAGRENIDRGSRGTGR